MARAKAAPAKSRKAAPAKAASKKKSPATAKAAKAAPRDAKVKAAEDTGAKQQVRGRPFAPGQSGNPAGRPRGARSKLATEFINALQKDFAENGEAAIEMVRTTKPEAYLKTIAAVLPKVLEVEDEDGETQKVTGVLLVTKTRIEDLIAEGSE